MLYVSPGVCVSPDYDKDWFIWWQDNATEHGIKYTPSIKYKKEPVCRLPMAANSIPDPLDFKTFLWEVTYPNNLSPSYLP